MSKTRWIAVALGIIGLSAVFARFVFFAGPEDEQELEEAQPLEALSRGVEEREQEGLQALPRVEVDRSPADSAGETPQREEVSLTTDDDLIAALEDDVSLLRLATASPETLETLPVINPESVELSDEERWALRAMLEARRDAIAETQRAKWAKYREANRKLLRSGDYEVLESKPTDMSAPEPTAEGQMTAYCSYKGQWVITRVDYGEFAELDTLVGKERSELRMLVFDIADFFQAASK